MAKKAKRERIKQAKIKPKVLFGFMLILSVALTALWITYRGFVELTETQQSLSDPSRKLIKLNSLLTDIYEAESNIRTYTFTQNESYLSIYLSFMKNINLKVDSLLILTKDDEVQAEKIRFIQNLLSKKRRVLSELVELKRNDQTSRFYAMALEEVEKLDLDSIKESSVITSITTTKTSRRDTVVGKPIDESQQSALSRFFRWFSKKEQEDTTISKLIVEVETKIDTLRKSVMSPSDSLLNEVMQILQFMQEQQEMALYNISEMELELLQSDKEIMDQIRTVVSLLEREELMNSYRVAEQVRDGVSKSTTLLLILGGTAFLLVILFTSIIFKDISKANFYRNQLLQAKQYAEKLLKVKEEFLANMNHEIRTPLSAIIGLSKQLQRSVTDEKNRFYIDSLNSSSQHLLQIVNDILDLSKIEGNYIKFEAIPFSPKEVAQDALNTFYLKAKEKGIETSITFESECQNLAIGDPFRLKQILFNLISNAIKFTNSGSISVDIVGRKKSEEEVCYAFSVSDSGIGIPAAKLDTIFDQFSQVDSSITRMYGGTGLGLTIVKKLTELQGGKVDVKSEVSKGTTFTIEINYRIAKDEQITSRITTTSVQLPSDLKIVVVDDDPIGQLLVREMLKSLGVTPLVFDNVKEALQAIKTEKPAFVLTDIQMPEQSGFDLVNEVNNLNLEIEPIIVALTANSMADNPTFYSSAGFQSALIKPFDEIGLYNTLAPYLNIKPIEEDQPIANDSQGVNGDTEYDISDIHRFAGNDNESTKAILQSFIDNSQANLKNLSEMAHNNDLQGVGDVAHRMKSAFRQLKVYKLSNTLEELENTNPDDLSHAELVSSVQTIAKEVKRVQALLKEDIDKL